MQIRRVPSLGSILSLTQAADVASSPSTGVDGTSNESSSGHWRVPSAKSSAVETSSDTSVPSSMSQLQLSLIHCTPSSSVLPLEYDPGGRSSSKAASTSASSASSQTSASTGTSPVAGRLRGGGGRLLRLVAGAARRDLVVVVAAGGESEGESKDSEECAHAGIVPG